MSPQKQRSNGRYGARHNTPPLVSFILVTYRNEETIAECLFSIRRWTRVPFAVILVDNSPDTATWTRVADIRRQQPELDITAVRSPENLGFARACNLGASQAQSDFLLFLNPDTTLSSDIATAFLEFWENRPHAGLLGPQVQNTAGEITRTCRNLPNVRRILLDATGLDRIFGSYRLLRFHHRRTRQVPQIIGACLFTSRQVFTRLNGFDERFFVYFEEVDLCKRTADIGLEVWFLSTATIRHKAGTSCEHEHSVADMVAQLRKSRQQYFRKHFPPPACVGVTVITLLEAWAKALILSTAARLRGSTHCKNKAHGFWRVATCPASWR